MIRVATTEAVQPGKKLKGVSSIKVPDPNEVTLVQRVNFIPFILNQRKKVRKAKGVIAIELKNGPIPAVMTKAAKIAVMAA